MAGRRQLKPLLMVCLLSTGLVSQVPAADYRQFPGAPADDRTLRIQERVEDIYAAGDFERALLIYEKELAPSGDKYAQYMVGFMHLSGEGVAEDPVEAFAWYRLAAERGEASLIAARDDLAASLDGEQLDRASERFAVLWRQYGDRKLLLDLLEKDLALLRRGTGNGNGFGDPGVRLAAGYADRDGGDPVHERLLDRARERLAYLETRASPETVGIEPDDRRLSPLDAQWRNIRRQLRILGVR